MVTSPEVSHAMALPPCEWNAWMERQLANHPGKLQDIEAELSAITVQAAMLAEYIVQRYTSGCGDQGHAKAAKEVMKKRAKIRKAMGYTLPAAGAFHF